MAPRVQHERASGGDGWAHSRPRREVAGARLSNRRARSLQELLAMQASFRLMTFCAGAAVLAACSGPGGAPPDAPPAAACGNGALEAPEVCDDGNTVDGDGCDHNCTIT